MDGSLSSKGSHCLHRGQSYSVICFHPIWTSQRDPYGSGPGIRECEILDIKKTQTNPWHPSGNGLIERFDRTSGEMLRQRVSLDQKDWDEDLHLMTMAYRSTIHKTTGMTPNLMMLGRELPMPSHLFADPPEEVTLDRPDYIQKLIKSFQGAFQDVRKIEHRVNKCIKKGVTIAVKRSTDCKWGIWCGSITTLKSEDGAPN